MVKKDKLTKEIEEQEKIRNVESAKLQDLIDKKEKIDLIPFAKTYLGKCFKFHNSIGTSSPRWWLYLKVVKVKGVKIHYITFEKTSYGKIEFDTNETTLIWNDLSVFDSNYIEITKEEFELARQLLLRQIKTLGKDI